MSNILKKIRVLFAEDSAEKVFIKTKDGQILSIKGKELLVDVEVFLVNADATETVLEDGDYILEDDSTVTVLAGKVSVITPKVEEEMKDEETEETENPKDKMEAVNYFVNDKAEIVLVDGSTPADAILYFVNENNEIVLVEIETIEEEVEETEETEEMKKMKTKMDAVTVELEAIKLEKENAVKELGVAKEAFAKLKAQPATFALDTRKNETQNSSKPTTMVDSVRAIMSKK